MTKRTAKGTKPTAKKSKRLSLSKQTIKDLTPSRAGAGAVRGGIVHTGPVACPPPPTIRCTRNPKPTMACTVKP